MPDIDNGIVLETGKDGKAYGLPYLGITKKFSGVDSDFFYDAFNEFRVILDA